MRVALPVNAASHTRDVARLVKEAGRNAARGTASRRRCEVSGGALPFRAQSREGMPFRWTLNPYRGARTPVILLRQTLPPAGSSSERRRIATVILVKTNLPEVLRRELARPAWMREQVAVGTATDPYQPIEGHYKLTRQSLEALCAARAVGLVTKGPMVVRDADLFKAVAAVASCTIYVSCPVRQRRCMAPSRTRYRVTLAAAEGCASAGGRRCARRRADGTPSPASPRQEFHRIDNPGRCDHGAHFVGQTCCPAGWHTHPLLDFLDVSTRSHGAYDELYAAGSKYASVGMHPRCRHGSRTQGTLRHDLERAPLARGPRQSAAHCEQAAFDWG